MRLHCCYFSRQNLETTVVGQGMLFKCLLLLAVLKNDNFTPRLYATVHQCVKFSFFDQAEHASIQAIVRCLTSIASQVSGKLTILL